MNYSVKKTEEEWKAQLGSERYRILRQKGTESPHSGAYNMTFDEGTYCCGACAEPLFESSSKFNAHCGWPSFDESISGKVEYIKDTTHGMLRTEIVCANCGSHLGHVFDDGPSATKQRYCVNSLSVDFQK
jgi:peptide-methionine (R)-S-oxide reductase